MNLQIQNLHLPKTNSLGRFFCLTTLIEQVELQDNPLVKEYMSQLALRGDRGDARLENKILKIIEIAAELRNAEHAKCPFPSLKQEYFPSEGVLLGRNILIKDGSLCSGPVRVQLPAFGHWLIVGQTGSGKSFLETLTKPS